MPFEELVNVFDKFVRLFIGFVGVSKILINWLLLAPSGNKSIKEYCTHRNLTSALEILVEHCDLAASSAESVKLKVGDGSFLLAGVVLSNSYQNTNVYNMVALGDRITYKKLQELIDDTFVI